MAMPANKVHGVRTAVVHDCYSAERSVALQQLSGHEARLEIAPVAAGRLVHEWLEYRFDEQSASAAKVRLIESYEASRSLGAEDSLGCAEGFAARPRPQVLAQACFTWGRMNRSAFPLPYERQLSEQLCR